MYRYFLFYCPYYYPSGGMKDCVLKTNNVDELVPFINENYGDEPYLNSFHYYDAVEDKTWCAEMEEYQNDDYFERQRFVCWYDEDF